MVAINTPAAMRRRLQSRKKSRLERLETPYAVKLRRQRRADAIGVIASIQQGQKAASSLSKAGGEAPDTELTPQALAEMRKERFAEILNELQARGDKTKLMQLFGRTRSLNPRVLQ